jgi:hypothetical protein
MVTAPSVAVPIGVAMKHSVRGFNDPVELFAYDA